MKFFIIIFIIFSCFLVGYSQNTEDKIVYDGYRYTLKTAPFAPLIGPIFITAEYRFIYEPVLSDNQTFQIGVSLLGKNFILKNMEETDSAMKANNFHFYVTGYRIQLWYKYFIDLGYGHDKAPEGFYIGPLFSYSNARFTTKYLNSRDDYIAATYINYNIIAGYQVILRNRICFDSYIGFGYKDNEWHEYFNRTKSPINEDEYVLIPGNLKLVFGINVGYSFK
ncbi:MAG: hypothetical protein Kow0068_20990 [Marinilabiliales bacterium]